MRRFGLLAIWVLGILFPLAWLGRFSVVYRQGFEAVFAPETMHVIMHLMLYAGLVMIGIWTFQAALSIRALLVALMLTFMIGLLQELFQAWSNGILLLYHLAYDLGVDLLGGTAGLVLVWLWRMRRRCL